MIGELFRAVAYGLKKVKPCTVYLGDVPQHFKQPSFLVSVYEQEASGSLNHKKRSTVRFDVMYFPEACGPGAKEECWQVCQTLNRDFRIPGFKLKGRSIRTEDNVLHYQFDVTYLEYREGTDTRMQDMIQKTDVKED